MDYDHFIMRVQERAHLASPGDAVVAIRSVLQALAQRIKPESAAHLAAQLPRGIGEFLTGVSGSERFSLDEFYRRTATSEYVDKTNAAFHAHCVMGVLSEAVTAGQMAKIRAQLPAEFQELFEAERQETERQEISRAPH